MGVPIQPSVVKQYDVTLSLRVPPFLSGLVASAHQAPSVQFISVHFILNSTTYKFSKN